MFLFVSKKRIRFNLIILVLLSYVIAYFISIMLSIAIDGFSTRHFASFNNLYAWINGLLITIFMYNIKTKDVSFLKENLPRVYLVLSVFIGLLFISGLVLYNKGYVNIEFPSLIQHFISNFGKYQLLEDSTKIKIVKESYIFNIPVPRFSIMSPYANAYGALGLLIVPFLLFEFTKSKGVKKWLVLILLILTVASVFFSFSRTAIIILLFGLAFYVYSKIERYKRIMLVFIFLSLVFLSLGLIYEIFITILYAREGSSWDRFRLYMYSIEYIFNQNPIIGIGIKPFVDEFNIPVGSHSTYIGAFVKTGILGFSLIVMYMLLLTKKCFEAIRYGDTFLTHISLSLVSLNLWSLTEDIDAPHLVNFLYFLHLGLFLRIIKGSVRKGTEEIP